MNNKLLIRIVQLIIKLKRKKLNVIEYIRNFSQTILIK